MDCLGKVMQCLMESGWKVEGNVTAILREAFSGIGATKIVEDAFQRERGVESRKTAKRISHQRKWMAPVHAKVAPKVHRFAEVDWEGEVVKPD